ncbi:MAG TPA: hypothetical protein VMF91_20205 [Bryobacteraceae bacterium]|nr:hypothetical protein [Bryobacteraceae bacterium]
MTMYGGDDKFAGAFHLSGSANAGKFRQSLNSADNRLSDIAPCRGLVLLDAFDSGFKLVGGFGLHRMSLTAEIAG